MIPTVTRSKPRSVAYFLDVTSSQSQVSNAMVVRKRGFSCHFYTNLLNLLMRNNVSMLLITVLDLPRKWLLAEVVTSTGDVGYTI